MKTKWEIVLTLGVLFVLLMLAKPHLDARPPAPTSTSGDWFIDTLTAAQTQTIGGPSLIVAVAIVAAFAWWSLTQERKLNGCMGPVASVGLAALALWALFMLGGG